MRSPTDLRGTSSAFSLLTVSGLLATVCLRTFLVPLLPLERPIVLLPTCEAAFAVFSREASKPLECPLMIPPGKESISRLVQ